MTSFVFTIFFLIHMCGHYTVIYIIEYVLLKSTSIAGTHTPLEREREREREREGNFWACVTYAYASASLRTMYIHHIFDRELKKLGFDYFQVLAEIRTTDLQVHVKERNLCVSPIYH